MRCFSFKIGIPCWGKFRSALSKLPDSGFLAKQGAAAHRQTLVDQILVKALSKDIRFAWPLLRHDLKRRSCAMQLGRIPEEQLPAEYWPDSCAKSSKEDS